MAHHQASPADDWQAIREMAERHYREGMDILGCIATLERGNVPTVVDAINDAHAGRAAVLIRLGLFYRILLTTMRCYDLERNGDKHLAVAVRLLKKPSVIDLSSSAKKSYLHELLSEFDRLSADARLAKLRHLRHKFVAHLSEPDPSIELPRIIHLLEFSKETARLMELLAFGTEVVSIKLDVQIDAYRESANAFWSKWG